MKENQIDVLMVYANAETQQHALKIRIHVKADNACVVVLIRVLTITRIKCPVIAGAAQVCTDKCS